MFDEKKKENLSFFFKSVHLTNDRMTLVVKNPPTSGGNKLLGRSFLEKLQPGPGPGGRMDAAGNVCSREIGAGGGTRREVGGQGGP